MISGDRSILQGKKGAFWYTLEELSKHVDRIDVITPKITSHQLSVVRSPFVNVFFHPSPHGLWHQPSWIRQKGKELIAQHHHDVMTIHDYPPFYNGMGGMRLSKETGVPAVQEIHHIVGYPVAASLVERIGRVMSRFHIPRSSQCAAAVRCVSEDTAATLRSWGVSNVHVVSSMYLDHDALQPDASIVPTFDVGCFGRLVPNKNVSDVLRAIATLPDARMLIVGDGPERGALEALTKQLGIAERVTFRGWAATNADLYRAMQEVRVVVVNSTSEGGPRVALEAMALGRPLVTTRVGLMPEVVDHGRNALFTTGEPQDLATKISMFIKSDTLCQTVGTSARAVLDRFERKKLIGEYANFLKTIAVTPSPSTSVPSVPSAPSAPSLLFITQSVDKNYVPLCFFIEWLREFGRRCNRVTVIAQQRGEYDLPENVHVFTLKKEEGKPRLLQVMRGLRLLWKYRKEYDAVFVHMTPIWIVIGAPLWLLLHKPMYLWYEIKTARWPLKVAVHLVRKVFSASPGGMPLKTPKSVLTGHGISLETFRLTDEQRDPYKIITVGRITAAKRLDLILQAFATLPEPYTMTIVGVPVTDADKALVTSLHRYIGEQRLEERAHIITVPDDALVHLLNQSTLFLHASERTSLDKAPLQAIACGCLLVSASSVVKPHIPEICRARYDNLAEVTQRMLHVPADEQGRLRTELRSLVEQKHSLPALIERLVREMT
jgi:glycosyltransferase involved in cell wall biosynthesis